MVRPTRDIPPWLPSSLALGIWYRGPILSKAPPIPKDPGLTGKWPNMPKSAPEFKPGPTHRELDEDWGGHDPL